MPISTIEVKKSWPPQIQQELMMVLDKPGNEIQG